METNQKYRQSNIELCRLVSIFLVVLVHSNFAWTGYPANELNSHIVRFLIQSFSIVGVNVFILITGYFGTIIKPKNIVNLCFICFYCACCKCLYGVLTHNFNLKDLFFISKSNWYIVSYLGLLLFTPLLKNITSKKTIILFCAVLFAYEVYFGFFPAFVDLDPGINHGYSIFSFITMYMIGRYLNLYGFSSFARKFSFLLYIFISVIIAVIAYFIFSYLGKFGISNSYFIRMYDYNNPLVILASIYFFITFVSLKIKNIKLINYLSQSVLTILLIHGSGTINPCMKRYFNKILLDSSGVNLVLFWIAGLFSIILISILVDQPRILLYRLFGSKLVNKTELIVQKINNKYSEE